MKYLYILLISAVFCGMGSAEMRVWHMEDGRSFKGEYLREQFGSFYFRDNHKQVHHVAITNLIPSHVQHIYSMMPPEMKLLFRKKTSRESGKYADEDATLIDGVASIKKLSKQPFNGVLSGELYFVAREVATDDYRMLAKKRFSIRFPETKDQTFQFKMSSRTRAYEEYNKIERRGCNYEGYLLIVVGPSGDILEMKTDLGWLDEEEIETFRQFKVFSFFDKDCRKRPVPRPKDYTRRGFM